MGRPKGSLGLRSRHAAEVMAKMNFNPIATIVEIYQIAITRFTEELDMVACGKMSPMESQAAKYLKIAADMACNLCSYVYPKLKSIEQVQIASADDLSPQERLELMRKAVKVLESQVESRDGLGP